MVSSAATPGKMDFAPPAVADIVMDFEPADADSEIGFHEGLVYGDGSLPTGNADLFEVDVATVHLVGVPAGDIRPQFLFNILTEVHAVASDCAHK